MEVNHAAEIDEIFDAISYRKGASVIRMLQSYLGAEVFQVFLMPTFLLLQKQLHDYCALIIKFVHKIYHPCFDSVVRAHPY